MKTIKLIALFSILCLLCISCGGKKKGDVIKSAEEAIREINEQPNLPEYVYMQDNNYCIHSYPKCPTLKYSGLKRLEVRTTDFTKKYYDFCGECVGDDLYKRLQKNSRYKDGNKRKLYDAISEEYDMGDFDTFANDVNDAAKRRKLYDAIKDSYDLGDFDSFSNQLLGSTEH